MIGILKTLCWAWSEGSRQNDRNARTDGAYWLSGDRGTMGCIGNYWLTTRALVGSCVGGKGAKPTQTGANRATSNRAIKR